MKREAVDGRHGHPTVLLDGIALHSRYDPRHEAQRFLQQRPLAAQTRTVVIVGEGLPYLSRAIAEHYPATDIVALGIGPAAASLPDRLVWVDLLDHSETALRTGLRSRLDPLAVTTLELLTWEPARRAAPDLVAAAERAVRAAVGDLRAELATLGSFGPRWLRNSLLNAILPDRRADLRLTGQRAMLATSGPSLTAALGRRPADEPVLATSSAWHTLRVHGVRPSLLVHTDGGFWARRYLDETDRQPGMPVLMPARAVVRPRDARAILPVFLATGWMGEVLHADREDWMRGSEQPSVALTLIHAIFRLHPILSAQLAGFDLLSRSLRSHAHPHPNDRYVARRSQRIAPLESSWARRSIAGDTTVRAWSDGVPGYRTPALEAFEPELAAALTAARSRGNVWLPPQPVALPEDATDRAERGTAQGPPLSVNARTRVRPPRAERSGHARRKLDEWWEQCGDPAGVSPELLLHLAPLELLAWRRGDAEPATVSAQARSVLERLRMLLSMVRGDD